MYHSVVTTGDRPFLETLRAVAVADLSDLRERMRGLSRSADAAWGVVSSGVAALDAVLPAGGFRRGTLVEWQADRPGAGTTLCALRAAREAMTNQRPLVIVDHDGMFHPPGLGSIVAWPQVLLVRCRARREAEWATDQALRASGVGAVLMHDDRGDERRMRRRQLAAEQSGAMGLIVRHLARQPEACFSDVRIRVSSLSAAEGRLLRLEILRSRQGGIGAVVDVRFDDDAHSVPRPTSASIARRAVGT